MSPLPSGYSRTKLDKLGDRLVAAPDEITDEDYAQLEAVLGCYQEALDAAQQTLERLGYSPTSRVKTTTTLVEKLTRTQGQMKLKGVQDVAGARIVVDDWREQDDAVEDIVAAFPHPDRPPRVRDRREEPTHGYRAVHVVVHHMGLPVEVQVRTLMQDLWAQIVERLGDTWGRGLRYEADFPDADEPVVQGDGTPSTLTRRQLMEHRKTLSKVTADMERMQAVALGTRDSAVAFNRAGDEDELEQAKVEFETMIDEIRATLLASYSGLTDTVRSIEESG